MIFCQVLSIATAVPARAAFARSGLPWDTNLVSPQTRCPKEQMPAANRRINRSATPSDLFTAAAAEVIAIGQAAIGQRGRFRLVLSGGTTPRGLHEALASAPFCSQLDWTRVEFFWGDERCVPPDHPESNYRMAHESLLLPLRIAAQQIHRMPAERVDLDRAARDYELQIAASFGLPYAPDHLPPLPAFDLILLGMGDDGHTASLFPHTLALAAQSRWVVGNVVPQLATRRLTMTAPLINQARQVYFLTTGLNKAVRLAEVLEGPRETKRLPSQLITVPHGKVVWFIDEAAGSQLTI